MAKKVSKAAEAPAKKKRKKSPPKYTEQSGSVMEAVSNGFGEVSNLAEEMRGWADNLEEKFSSTDRYARVSEAADALENATEPDVDETIGDLQVKWMELQPRSRRRGLSRADRLSNACNALAAASSVLRDFSEELEKLEKTKEVLHAFFDSNGITEGDTEEIASAASDLADEIDSATSELEGVEFPGMYG